MELKPKLNKNDLSPRKVNKKRKKPQKIQSKKNKNKHHGKILQKKVTGKYKIKHIIINT